VNEEERRKDVLALVLLFLTVWIALLTFLLTRNPLRVHITSPEDGAEVGYRVLVDGTLSDPSARLYLIVKPERGSVWFVQEPVQPRKRWRGVAYLGGKDWGVGEEFTIFALASHKPLNLLPGEIDEVPKADAVSNKVKVRRVR